MMDAIAWLTRFGRRMVMLSRHGQFDGDLEEEMRLHQELREEEQVKRGVSPEEAHYAARRRFGSKLVLREESREVWGGNWLETLLQHVRYGLRQLRRYPGFTAVAVVTLALGIGANAAVFSVMNAALLRFLPVPNPQQLVYLNRNGMPEAAEYIGNSRYAFNFASFQRLRSQHTVFSHLVAFVPLAIGRVPVRVGQVPEEAAADMVSGNFFTGLGVRPVRGREFTLSDETRHSQVAVLSYEFWTRRFFRNPGVIGRTIYIKSVPFTVIGVAARGFTGVEPGETATDLWIPFQSSPNVKPWGSLPKDAEGLYNSPKWWFLMMIGRLQPQMSWQRAIARLQPVFQRAAYEGIGAPHPKERLPRLYFSATGGLEKLRENHQDPLTVMMTMVAMVLLIACINVAMLLIARNTVREREFAMRLALGASRMRVFHQLLSEGVLLVAAGTVLGWIFALWGTGVLAAWSEIDLNAAPDHTVLAFTIIVAAVVTLALGIAPLRNATRVPFSAALKAGGSAGASSSKFRSRQVVMALQCALCLALLVGAGLLVRTLRNLETANLGFRASGLLVFGIAAPQSLQSDALHFYQALTQRLRVLPGVESVTLTNLRIGSGWSNYHGVRVDGVNPRGRQEAMVRWNEVGPDFCHVLGIRLLLGRDITDADSAAAQRVAVVNQTFAERYLPGRIPLGHEIQIEGMSPFTIVGVARDSKYTSVSERPVPMAWVPYLQTGAVGKMTVELRTYSHPLTVLPQVRRAVSDFGPDELLLRPMTQEAQMQESYSDEHLIARLATSFGLLAALLVATGLYGTLAYRVSRRTSEIGIRMALGAERSQVVWMILRESLTVGAVGIAIGLPLSIAGARLLVSMLFELKPSDPWTYGAAAGGVLLVALAAGLIPARRAANVDPMVAVRYE
jgi:predicted permease